jgi:hypothetical protein
MTTEVPTFADWLAEAQIAEPALSATQRPLLQAAFQFRQRCGADYYSTRLLSHFLLHCNSGLKVAQIARLVGFSRSAASAQQDLSSKEVIQAAHHRLAGRSHGKLLPRFAGPIARFLHEQPEATRWDLLDFIQRTWNVAVSRMALHRFLKRYGLDRAEPSVVLPASNQAAGVTGVASSAAADRTRKAAADPVPTGSITATVCAAPAAGVPVPRPPQEFFLPPRTTPAPSCSCPRPSTGSRSPKAVSRTPPVPCGRGC